MAANYDALRLQNQKHFDERLTAAHRQVAQAIAMLVIKAAGADGLIPNTQRAREALRAAIWQTALKPFYVGSGTDALIGPVPQSPYAKLLVDGITVATRIQAERQVAIVKRVCKDDEVVQWLTGPRASGVLTLPTTALPALPLAGIAFNPSTATMGGLRGPDGRIDVPRAKAALVNPRGNFSSFHEWVDPNGYRLSDRIWRSGLDVRARVDALMTYHIQAGTPAIEIAKIVEPFLTPGGALAKTKTPYGSEGSYSARRLARTEITAAGGKATIQAAAANPFVDSVQWRVSGSHPEPDECDDNAHGGPNGDGIYAIADVPRYPSHPFCLCSLLPVPAGNTADLVASLRADIQAAKGKLVDAASGGNALRAEALRGALSADNLTQSMLSGTLEQDVLAAVQSAASVPVAVIISDATAGQLEVDMSVNRKLDLNRMKELNTKAIAWKEKLTPEQRAAVTEWQGGDWDAIKNSVASGKLDDTAKNFMDALQSAPKVEGVVWRGIKTRAGSLFENTDDAVNHFSRSVGTVITWDAPSSTTVNPGIANWFADDIVFEIQSKTARHIGYEFVAEQVTMPNTSYRVHNVTKGLIDGREKWVVQLVEL